ncbi:forkhead box protein H1 [Periophthalmus magnuspinnatus]|uniref:forkhead box protein H1 n=1 Tax=Periophthalmus magnuspinnatus TaxID=409849 RepID=UPI00145A1926|nr:forkhead box protein H1 [Periophthalmus magnuspinnatus]
MTKHWPEHSLLAPPALSHLRDPHDHQLDFQRNAHHTAHRPSGVRRTSPAQHWSYSHPAYAGQTRLQEDPLSRPKHLTSAFMDNAVPPDSTYPSAEDMDFKQDTIKQDTIKRDAWCNEQEKTTKGTGKKKNYQRYPKPPYSYLAMIAMVIQRSPEKKLTLSEILKEISALFPFFKGNYKGWRDSVRHNLSSYDCFIKVLKDPGKPQGKGNFWAVELSRIPLELLKRQNTAVSRQDETIFAQDLAPYILQGQKIESEVSPPEPVTSLPSMRPRNLSPPQDDLFRPKLDSSFAIDSLLHSFRPSSGAGEVQVTKDCWSEMERPRGSPPRPRYASSARSASASSASPASTSSSSDDEWRGVTLSGKRAPDEAESDGYEDYKPVHKSARRDTVAPPWELPTSYAKYAPPNAVAPPSMRFNGSPLMPLHGGLPLYGYGSSPVTPGHFLGHTYWPILPNGRVQAPPLIMDLDNMLQSVPPNKSVFDVLVPTNQNSHHQPPSHYTLQNGPSLNRYPQY